MNGERTRSISVAVGIRGVRCWRLEPGPAAVGSFYKYINMYYVPASELGTRGANGEPKHSGSLTPWSLQLMGRQASFRSHGNRCQVSAVSVSGERYLVHEAPCSLVGFAEIGTEIQRKKFGSLFEVFRCWEWNRGHQA